MEQVSKISTDYSRSQAYVIKLQNRLQEVKAFCEACYFTLEKNQEKLDIFCEIAKAKSLYIGNMYSTGISNDEYNDDCTMIAHCKLALKVAPKNTKLAADRLQDKWAEIFEGKEISAVFNDYKIEGTTVTFQIWITPIYS